MKLVLYLAILAVVCLVGAQTASAHVLIKSTNGESAAILHVMPDDDPIAGQEASLMLDTQAGSLNADTKVSLTIANNTGGVEKAAAKTQGSLVSSTYTFPAQGKYSLYYEIVNKDSSYSFKHDIRVSRGIQSAAAATQRYPWAEALLIFVGIAGLGLGVVCWNNRKSIYNSSVL